MLILHNETLLSQMRGHYRLAELKHLTALLHGQGTFQFPALLNGLFPAAILTDDAQHTGYASVWVRDNVFLAYAHRVTGDEATASQTMQALMTYFRQHRQRFECIISGDVAPHQPMQRPHIRFDGQRLTELPQDWAHAQNDALGYFLWLYCTLALQGALPLTAADLAVLALFPPYFQAIQYWQDEDSGHWEEARKIEASSIGPVVAGLQAMQRLGQHLAFPAALDGLSDLIQQLIQQGETALYAILPAECIQPPPQARRYDAALLFLIYPLQIVRGEMADTILHDVRQHLQGDYGIRRYLGDSYWSADYKTKFPPDMRTANFSEDGLSLRDALLQPGQEAQWCIFDPILSAILGLRFQASGDAADLALQTHYLNRSLGQITAPHHPSGGWRCPELYYLERGQYIANDVTPLLWTQANLKLALHQMERSLLLAQP